jgi:hypothetical protein
MAITVTAVTLPALPFHLGGSPERVTRGWVFSARLNWLSYRRFPLRRWVMSSLFKPSRQPLPQKAGGIFLADA